MGDGAAAILADGFGDGEALGGQRCFRALLDAMGRPGRIVSLGAESLPSPPAPLAPATYALLLGLADLETPVWLDEPARARPAVPATLRFRCGCPLVDDPAAAAFAVVTRAATAPALAAFAPGVPEYPDRSTTLILQVAGLGAGERLRLTGPGVLGGAELAVAGARPGLWDELRANHRRYPLGVDLVLVDGRRLAALPRSTWVEGP